MVLNYVKMAVYFIKLRNEVNEFKTMQLINLSAVQKRTCDVHVIAHSTLLTFIMQNCGLCHGKKGFQTYTANEIKERRPRKAYVIRTLAIPLSRKRERTAIAQINLRKCAG